VILNAVRQRRISRLLFASFCFFLAAICYVFSIGPLTRLETHPKMPESLHNVITKVYIPLFRGADFLGLQGPLQSYIFLWMPDQSLTIPQNGFSTRFLK
jgi:hypothetical protein